MLEKEIEKRAVRYAIRHGQAEYKFNSMNRASVPDRLKLAPIPECDRETVAKYIRFVEYKKTGQVPTIAQEREHKRLRELGFVVEVIDREEDAWKLTLEMYNANL